MGSIVEWLTERLGGLLGGGLSGILSGLTDNIIVIGLTVFALALGFFAIRYLNRRRQSLDQQRMAALIKGLHYAGVPPEIFSKPGRSAHDHAMKGVRWLFGALGLSATLYGYESLQPAADSIDALRGALVGILPAAIAIAQFLCALFCRRKEQAAALPSRPMYRVARRRF